MKCKICGKEIADPIYKLHLERHKLLNKIKAEKTNYNRMNKNQLKEILNEKDIDYTEEMTKKELVNLLEVG